MKMKLLIASLLLLGCSIDVSGIPSVRYDGGRSDRVVISSHSDPAGPAEADASGTAIGGTTGSSKPGSAASASGGAMETTAIDAGNSTGGSSLIGGGAGWSAGQKSAPGPSALAGNTAGGLAGTAVAGQTGAIGGTTNAAGGTGENPKGGGAGTGSNPDAGAGGAPARDAGAGTSGAADATGAGGNASACVPAASGGPAGMRPGEDCLSCHRSEKKPRMTAGGTLYSSVSGGPPVVGATVTIIDSKGTKITMVTGSSGNFYTSTPISFPATVEVSKCPDTLAKSATLGAGGCNSCHPAGARLHLP